MRQSFLIIPAVVLTFATNLWAQVQGAPADKSWLTPAAAVILAGFIIAVSIKKSKREHRD